MAEALTTLHSVLILLLLLVKVLSHALACILSLSSIVCDLLLELCDETIFLVLLSLLNQFDLAGPFFLPLHISALQTLIVKLKVSF